MNLLNIKYIVAAPGIRHQAFDVVATEGDRALYRNRTVLPRAFLAGTYEVVPRQAMIARLEEPAFDPAATVLLEDAPSVVASAPYDDAGEGKATWVEYGPNRLRLSVSAPRASHLVVTNAYVPYWHARIDGEEAPLVRADYAFQAVPIAAGEHDVELYFRSRPFLVARVVSLGAALFLAAGAALVYLRRRKGREAA